MRAAVLPMVVEALHAWQRGPHAHEPLVLTPLDDGESIAAQVGGRAEMSATDLIEYLGISRHAFYKTWIHCIPKNRNGKYSLGPAAKLKDRIHQINR